MKNLDGRLAKQVACVRNVPDSRLRCPGKSDSSNAGWSNPFWRRLYPLWWGTSSAFRKVECLLFQPLISFSYLKFIYDFVGIQKTQFARLHLVKISRRKVRIHFFILIIIYQIIKKFIKNSLIWLLFYLYILNLIIKKLNIHFKLFSNFKFIKIIKIELTNKK